MKPDNYKKTHSKHRTNARVKMYLRSQLAWLWGYPVKRDNHQLHWKSFYYPAPWEAQSLNISKQHLQSATYYRNKLIRDFPKALSRIVGDVDIWSQRIDVKITQIQKQLDTDRCKPLEDIANNTLCTRDYQLVQKIYYQHPSKQPLFDQFIWWLSTNDIALREAFLWLEKQSVYIDKIIQQNHADEDLIFKLFFLNQQVEEKRMENILAILSSPTWKTARPNRISNKKLKNFQIIHPEQGENLSEKLCIWLTTLLQQSRKSIKQHIQVLNTLYPLETIQSYSEQWEVIETIPKLLKEKQRQTKRPWEYILNHSRFIDEQIDNALEQIKFIKTPRFEATSFKRMLYWYTENPALFNGLKNLIKALHIEKHPEESAWKSPYLTLYLARYWYSNYHAYNRSEIQSLIRFLPQLTEFLHGRCGYATQKKRLHLLSFILQNSSTPDRCRLDHVFLYNYHQALPTLAKFCDANDHYIQHDVASNILADHKLLIHSKRMSQQQYLAYIQYLYDANISFNSFYYDDEWSFIHLMLQGDTYELIPLLERWGTLEKEEEQLNWKVESEETRQTGLQLHQEGFGEIADYFADRKEYTLLEQCGRLLEYFKERLLTPPKPEVYNDRYDTWIMHYPDELRDVLQKLNCYHPEPEKIAKQQLGHYYPHPETLKTEILFLQKKLEQLPNNEQHRKLSTRVNNLQNRLKQPNQPSDKIIVKLRMKLRHTAYFVLIQQWYKHIQETIRLHVKQELDISEENQPILADNRYLSALSALLILPKRTQTLAKEIIQRRSQSNKPWDFRDSSANQHFIQNMQRLGIQTKPWIDGIGVLEYRIEDQSDKPLDLYIRLEDDPLEVFRMGEHFKTCLSPFDFNFFSVVANAADINKRIIYLKDKQQKIIGRCLFALNNQGHLLNFWPYSHIGADKINPAVNAFADKLAHEMHTIRSSQGTIRTLLANDWYDDGAEAYKTIEPEFVSDKNFHQRLLQQPLSKSHQDIKMLFSQSSLTQIVVQHLLRLDIFKKRPALCLVLVDILKSQHLKDNEIRYYMTKYLLACDQRSLAISFAKHLELGYQYSKKYSSYQIPEKHIKLLITINPSLARKALLKSRPNYIVDDKDDHDIRRLFHLGEIHQSLHQPRKAHKLYKIIMKNPQAPREIKQKVRKNIAEVSLL